MHEFRPAVETDLPAIVGMLADDDLGHARERLEAGQQQTYLEAFRKMARQDGNRLIVADVAGEVVGCMQVTIVHGLSRMGATRAQIEAVRIKRGWRGRGIGHAMIRHAIETARTEGCRLVQLTSDRRRIDARRFYESLGFVASHVGMKLDLPPT